MSLGRKEKIKSRHVKVSVRNSSINIENYKLDEVLRVSRVVEAKTRGIKYVGKKPSKNVQKIIRTRGEAKVAMRTLNDSIVKKNEDINKPTDKAKELYIKLLQSPTVKPN